MFHAGACCVFITVFSPHRHPANTTPAHPVSVPIRHPSDKISAVTSFETFIYLHRKCNKIPGTYAVYSCVWRPPSERSALYRLTLVYYASSACSIGTFLASQSSHLNNTSFYTRVLLAGEQSLSFCFRRRPVFSHLVFLWVLP